MASTALPIEIFGVARQRLGLLADQPHRLEMVPRSLKIKVYPVRPTAEVTKELMPKRILLSYVCFWH